MILNAGINGALNILLFNLRRGDIPNWFNKKGEPITSCVLTLAEERTQYKGEKAQEEAKEPAKPKYTDSVLFALDTFREAAKLHGKIITDNSETGHEFIRLDFKD